MKRDDITNNVDIDEVKKEIHIDSEYLLSEEINSILLYPFTERLFLNAYLEGIDLTSISSLRELKELRIRDKSTSLIDLSFLDTQQKLEKLSVNSNGRVIFPKSCTARNLQVGLRFVRNIEGLLSNLTDWDCLVSLELYSIDDVEYDKISLDLSELAKTKCKSLKISDYELEHIIFPKLPTLETLKLFNLGILNIDLSQLSPQSLKELIINGCKKIDNIDLTPLSNAKSLDNFVLLDSNISNIDLSPLENCLSLSYLDIGNNNLTTIDLKPLNSLKHLNHIELNCNQIKHFDFSWIRPIESLTNLDLHENPLEDVDLMPLIGCNNLKSLAISTTDDTIDITPLSNLTSLSTLQIIGDNLNEIDITPMIDSYFSGHRPALPSLTPSARFVADRKFKRHTIDETSKYWDDRFVVWLRRNPIKWTTRDTGLLMSEIKVPAWLLTDKKFCALTSKQQRVVMRFTIHLNGPNYKEELDAMKEGETFILKTSEHTLQVTKKKGKAIVELQEWF